MRKTSVYLTEEEAEGLRRAAKLTGRSQSELLREAVHRVVLDVAPPERTFHSMGAGRGNGEPYTRWNADELYRKVMGHE